MVQFQNVPFYRSPLDDAQNQRAGKDDSQHDSDLVQRPVRPTPHSVDLTAAAHTRTQCSPPRLQQNQNSQNHHGTNRNVIVDRQVQNLLLKFIAG